MVLDLPLESSAFTRPASKPAKPRRSSLPAGFWCSAPDDAIARHVVVVHSRSHHALEDEHRANSMPRTAAATTVLSGNAALAAVLDHSDSLPQADG
jgi:hypothetical protein